MEKTKWVLSLRKVGQSTDEAPEVQLTNEEMDNIVENVRESCLHTEDELMWLFVEAGVEIAKQRYRVSIALDGIHVDAARDLVEAALREAGVKFHEGDTDVDEDYR